MISIGPYRFSQQDARATVAHADEVFDLLAAGTGAAGADIAARHRPVHGADAPLADRVASVWGGWSAASAALRAAGSYGPDAAGPEAGTVTHLARSDGGVPKTSVERVSVTFRGIEGDRQATRRHHGRPWQALCLWSAEVIEALVADGHPIGPGAAGENVTVRGLDWGRVRPGVRLRIGDVLAEVSSFAVPCRQNARWFTDGRFDRIHHRHGPVSRVYATVVEPGAIALDDRVELLATD